MEIDNFRRTEINERHRDSKFLFHQPGKDKDRITGFIVSGQMTALEMKHRLPNVEFCPIVTE